MKISNARVYRNGRFERSSVEFSDKISAFDVEGGVDAHGAYLVPGFIDIHTHGAIGYDASDCRADEIPALAGYYAAHGVTSFCFTTMTIGEDALAQAMSGRARRQSARACILRGRSCRIKSVARRRRKTSACLILICFTV